MKDRIEKLESENHSISRVLTELQLALEKLSSNVNAANAKVDAHIKEERKYEQTIRNIDDNINAMRVDLARLPNETNNAINAKINPMWDSIRKHDSELKDFKVYAEKEHNTIGINAERRIQRQVGVLVSVCSVLLYLIYSDMKEDIVHNQKTETAHIVEFNKSRTVVQKNLNTTP